MKITDNTGHLIHEIDVIMRSHMGNQGDKDKLYHAQDPSETSVKSLHYAYIRELYMGSALIEVLEYLERTCNIDFDKQYDHDKSDC